MIPGAHVAIIIILRTLCTAYISSVQYIFCVARGVLEREPTLLDHVLDNS